jgi:hypothetical protein
VLFINAFYHFNNGFAELETQQGFTGANEANLYVAMMGFGVVQKVADDFLGGGFADFNNAVFVDVCVEMAVGATKLAFARERNTGAVDHD